MKRFSEQHFDYDCKCLFQNNKFLFQLKKNRDDALANDTTTWYSYVFESEHKVTMVTFYGQKCHNCKWFICKLTDCWDIQTNKCHPTGVPSDSCKL